jgi:cysteine desulfurase
MPETAIYFDNHATTKLDPKILDKLVNEVFLTPSNASSIQHSHGDFALDQVKRSTRIISDYFGATDQNIIYTSGATEAANLVIQSVLKNNASSPKLIASSLEHPCILDTGKALADKGICGFELVEVDGKGRLNLEDLEQKSKDATLGCFMAANNEIGNIYPLKAIAAILKANGCLFLCDATQFIGKESRRLLTVPDYVIFSGHKIHGLQGIGALVIQDAMENLSPVIFGGGHQKGLRSGTLNVAGIVSLGEAISGLSPDDNSRMKRLRDMLWQKIQGQIPEASITGDVENKVCNNLHFCVPRVNNTIVVEQLRGQVSLSTGSACASNTIQPSKVLQAMRVPAELMEGAIRIGLSKFTTENEIELGARLITDAIQFAKEF